MTRFARAVGSKSSNKREEEEATPWSMMVAGVSQDEMFKTIMAGSHIVIDIIGYLTSYRLKDKTLE